MINSRSVPQSDLTAECWMIQFMGPDACKECAVRDTDECGGKEIRKTGKNAKGKTVPLGAPL